MIWAVFKIMALRLFRDRGALVLAFVLPGFIYAVFAAIFSTASGGSLDMRVALAVTNNSPATLALSQKIQDQTDFSVSFDQTWDTASVRERVRLGTEDVGLILRGDVSDPSDAPIEIIFEPSRKIASDVLSGQVRQIIGTEMPDVLLGQQLKIAESVVGDFSPAQAARARAALSQTLSGQDSFIQTRSAIDDAQAKNGDASVAYYVGATAILFLLFSAMQGASLSLEERANGITDRLLMGFRGASAMLLGKFSFLTLQGTVQAGVIIAVAATFFDVTLSGNVSALLLACVLAASVAAALALLVATLCKSTVQMNTVATFLVLLFSALGGSMVPRFMMPNWMQSLGDFTPNSWVIELFYGILARGSDASQLTLPVGILIMITLACLCLASFLSHRLMRF